MVTQATRYDPAWVANYYDAEGEKEWHRFSRSPVDRLNYEVHAHYLRQTIAPESRVLEVGPGPGRFTRVLAELGCRVFVADISAVQLELHRKYASELGFEHCVASRQQLDICDLGVLDSGAFDAVVCYGGQLSYVFERAGLALRECARVCRQGGHILASVMSLWGSLHRDLNGVLDIPAESNWKIIATGDLSPENWSGVTHRCHMFRSGELRSLATSVGLCVKALSASSFLSINWDDCLSGIEAGSAQWAELVEMELAACRAEGCLDAGTHIVMVAEKV